MEIDASIVLDELVHQFADPMAFFRELIQNALDAGTGEIEVRVDWEASDGHSDDGRMTVEIRDYGVGMDRQVIQNELLKLFNSGKDRDLTKIGRFGIGFVSVFAVEPDAVCVDTGRTGESWRLLFDADRSYELLERDIPFEGTSVRLFKSISRADFVIFKKRAREVIYKWCKHVDAPILFNGDPLGAVFDIDSPCKVRMETEGTRIVAGYTNRKDAPYGYYHSGLTLMEGVGGPWSHVSFKLDSRYLEHTLTRDQIIEDKNFHKALDLLETVVEERLPQKLLTSLEHAVAERDLEAAEALAQAAIHRPVNHDIWGNVHHLDRGSRQTRRLFPVIGGEPVTASRLESTELLLWNEGPSKVVAHLPPDARVLESPGGHITSFASLVLERNIPSTDHAFCYIESEAPELPAERDLANALVATLTREDAPSVSYGSFYSANRVANQPWVAVDDTDQSQAIESLPPTSVETLRRARHIVLNRTNPLVSKLLKSAASRPAWAALMLVVLTCPDATADDPGADQLLRAAYQLDMEAP